MWRLARLPAVPQSDADIRRATWRATGKTLRAARHWRPVGRNSADNPQCLTVQEVYGGTDTDYFNFVSVVVR